VTGRLLAAGFSTRHIAASARRAGYGVVAVDHFCDLDLVGSADACVRFETLDELASLAARVARDYGVDGFLAGSGAETLVLPVPLLGTPPATAARFLDKGETQSFFEDSACGPRADWRPARTRPWPSRSTARAAGGTR
jgi:uncharacterized protein